MIAIDRSRLNQLRPDYAPAYTDITPISSSKPRTTSIVKNNCQGLGIRDLSRSTEKCVGLDDEIDDLATRRAHIGLHYWGLE